MAFISQFLSFITVAAHVIIAGGILYFLLFPQDRKKAIVNLLGKNVLLLSFMLSLIATLGSLFFSEVAGFEPCRLCWFQRIFMYPQTILLGLAWARHDEKIIDYVLGLSLVGGGISLYHNYIYYFSQAAAFCRPVGQGASCTEKRALGFGYISIPLMALTAFILLIALFIIHKVYLKREKQ